MKGRNKQVRSRSRLLGWLLLALVLSGIGCGMREESEPSKTSSLYFLSFGVALDKELNSLDASFGGGDFGGQVGVLINGVPVKCRRGGGSLESINEWLIDGTNEIQIDGQHREALSLKVLRANRKEYEATGQFRELLAEARFPTGDKADPIVFTVELPWKAASLDSLEHNSSSREDYATEIGRVVATLRSGIINEQGSEWADLLMAGIREYGDACGQIPGSDLKGIKKEVIEKYRGTTASRGNADAIQFLWGKRGVLAFSGFDRFGRSFSINLVRGNKQIYVPALVFVRRNGKWEIWNQP